MKRALCEQTDSISAKGDSVQIENINVKIFYKHLYLGFRWIMRPDWLQYEIVGKENIETLKGGFDCFKIEATPLDSHYTTKNHSAYSQNSWVTSDKIIRTSISHPLPDSIWGIPNYSRIDLIDEINNSLSIPIPEEYRNQVFQRGWN